MRFKCYLSVFCCVLLNCLSDGGDAEEINKTSSQELATKLIDPNNSPMKIPVCCPVGETYNNENVCTKTDIPFKLNLHIFTHNTTHINICPFNNSNIIPYYHQLNCSKGYFSLEKDESILLRNGSIIVIFDRKVINNFCIQSIYNESSKNDTSLINICYDPEHTRNPTLYAMFISVSSLSALALVFGAAAFYWVLYLTEDIHRKCVLIYFVTLFFTIVFQLLVLLPVEGICTTIGYFFQTFYMMSTTWLTILCYDLYYTVRYFNEDTSKGTRMNWYIACSIIVTSVSFAITITDGTPCIPNSFLKIDNSPIEMMCDLGGDCEEPFFYIPFLEMAVCITCLILSFIMIFRKPSSNSNIRYNYDWLEKMGTYKTMFRRNLIYILISTAVLVIQFQSSSLTLMTILFPAQGFLLVGMYACERRLMKELKKKFPSAFS